MRRIREFSLLVGLSVLSVLYSYGTAYAQQGLVTSRTCPYSCKSAGIRKKHCRDWRKGNTCYVEDLRKSAHTSSSNAQGYISSRACPYSCGSVGLSKSICRDWKKGNICYVEDLTRPRQSASVKPIPLKPYPVGTPVQTASECTGVKYGDIAPPRIDVNRQYKSGNFFKDVYRVKGSVEGICLKEAGYFEYGKKVESIPVRTARDFSRIDFSVQARINRNPEIRVYNVAGDRDIYRIEGESF